LETIYLDSAATTPVKPEVAKIVFKMMRKESGNPSSLHELGVKAEKELKLARTRVAESIKAQENQVIFTSGGTEANNLAILGLSRRERNLITTKIEHPSVIEIFRHFEREGRKVDFLDVDEKGYIDLEGLGELLDFETGLVSIGMVNNEIGTIQDLKKAIKIIREKSPRAIIHTDAVQAWGKIPLNVNLLQVDTLTLSAHKMGGPKGVGALFVRRPELLQPIILGGGQERGFRSGTENIPGVVGMGKAAVLLPRREKMKRVEKIKEAFFQEIKEKWANVKRVGPEPFQGVPHILNLSFPGFPAQVLVQALSQEGVYVSAGSACSSKNETSYILEALGLEREVIKGALRFSFLEDITPEQGKEAVKRTIKVLKKLKKVMGYV